MKRTFLYLLFILLVSVSMSPAEDNPPPAPHPADVTPDPWPKTSQVGGTTYTIYQPQLDSWDGYLFKGQSAVSVQPAGVAEPIFGVLQFSAKTIVDRVARTVYLNDLTILKINMPSAPGGTAAYQKEFLALTPAQGSTMSLDRLEAMLAIDDAEELARKVPVKNEPPKFIFSQNPAILIPIDGEPSWQPVQGTSLQRAVNTRALVFLDDTTGKFYIHLFDGYVTATSLAGPWTVATSVPPSVYGSARQLNQQRVVDMMEGQPDQKTGKKPSLMADLPRVVVATTPTELVVTSGRPDWAPIPGTRLLYVDNTTGNIFKHLDDQQTYILVAGRWFRASDLTGPWQYVAGKDLPPDFALIPDDSPKENVKASVPKTTQAQEAAIAATIPQTATVDRSKATFTPNYNGTPELRAIEGTTLMYVANSPFPVIMVAANEWYAVKDGIWFTASSAHGPWFVATSIPAVIYSIPPSSPLNYVTYVKVYDVTPRYVVVGYTPGYMGTIVTADGAVVYGTGYAYPPYIYSSVWYPYPVTYGYAASVTYTPWTGWAIGFGFGWAMWGGYACAPAPYWGAMPYARYGGYYGGYYGPRGGAAVWGPRGWAATSGNVYNRYGTTGAVTRTSGGYNAWTGQAWSNKVGASYNSTNGRISAGQRASVSNVYNGNYASGQRGATYNPTTGVSARGGSATYGNAYTGTKNTAAWGKATGPGGQSVSAVKSGNNVYAGKDGNVYKYNSQSGTAQRYSNGSWSSVDKTSTAAGAGTRQTTTTQSLQAQQAARQKGDSRSAASSWGSNSWGGGFNRSAGGSAATKSSAGSGAAARSSAGGGAAPKASSGGGGFSGGGSRSWGGGDFGGRSFGGGGGSRGGGGFGGGGGGFRGGGGGGRR
jgi:hypothetical protein